MTRLADRPVGGRAGLQIVIAVVGCICAIAALAHAAAASDRPIKRTPLSASPSIDTTSARAVVPLRWCAVEGSAAASDPTQTDSKLLSYTSAATAFAWLNGSNVGFRSAIATSKLQSSDVNFPIIKDPNTTVGQPGDIELDGGFVSLEFLRAIDECEAAWQAQQPLAVGIPVLNVRQFVGPQGFNVGTAGITQIPQNGALQSAALCDTPHQIDPSFLPQWLGIEDRTTTLDGNQVTALAHELGHALMLGHGDGLDNDGNGRYDEYCDPNEPVQAANLMNPNAPNNVITALQSQTARDAAAQEPGIYYSLYSLLHQLGFVFSDQVVDTLGDTTNPAIDILSAALAVDRNSGQGVTTIQLAGKIPTSIHAKYTMFIDADGNSTTGGSPSLLGFPTSFSGAEIVASVGVTSTGTSRLVPRVWRWDSSTTAFVLQRIAGIIPRDNTGSDADTGHFTLPDVISLTIPAAALGTISSHPRIQTLAQNLDTGAHDRIPASAVAGVKLNLAAPSYPACDVTPTPSPPGQSVTVTATHLLPDSAATVTLDGRTVATGTTDSTGKTSASFVIPAHAHSGDHLVVVASAGTAVSSDCAVSVT
jgi:hypothetical protein